MNQINENNTIIELCGLDDGKTNFESYVVQTSEVAIRKPLKELSNEEIRLLIVQKIGLKYIIPKALDILRKNILIECQYFRGDLLDAILSLSGDDWENNDIKEFIVIVNNSHRQLEKLKDKSEEAYDIDLFNKVHEFLLKNI